MPSEYAKSLGARLRSIRQQQGLSLQGVEEKSTGRWKAVVVGSYERGDRAVTVSRLAELAEFYRVPVAELLPEGSGVRHEPTSKIVLDLERLYDEAAEDLAYVARYARAIQQQRGDYNGRVLSIRADDLRALAIVYDASPSGLIERLTEHGVLVADPRAFFAVLSRRPTPKGPVPSGTGPVRLGGLRVRGAGQRVAYSAIRPSMPLRKRGESSVDICRASSTASLIATASSISST